MSPASNGRVIPVGTRCGRLTVVVERHPPEPYVICRCDCGATHNAPFSRWGNSRSCGCLRRDTANNLTHGQSRTPLHRSWCSMLNRCFNPNNGRYADYGGRGITVCERWRGVDGFVNFANDMGERPPGLTLDRIDNDGNYEPGNCRWATYKQQNNNKRPYPRPTHCGKGHEFTEDNTYTNPSTGLRSCRTCRRLRDGSKPRSHSLP